ncbi:helicase [Bordetella genomosp. 10]|uniref:Helicase n=1 Tax=Bordetella genomosp. 10 TaxID=1416804 RepID=A0A261SAT3_9BORD|nr:AAA domain-containing protein [Bordetella genomosp. 10]OZI34285.1 helicase [Bordetella genomosp. 10]
MVSIFMNGQDKTHQTSDWRIWWDAKRDALMLTCEFRSGKSFTRPLSECSVAPAEELRNVLFAEKGRAVYSAADSAVIYDGKYAVVQYRGNPRQYVKNAADLVFTRESAVPAGNLFGYFVSVARARLEQAVQRGESGEQGRLGAEAVLSQMAKVTHHPETALHAYCMAECARRERDGALVFPFGVNESQLQAVERAFASQISLIEGPPGTGKTQTILNIVANIVLRGKTVAIVSNNNSAVENVYQKLDKAGLGYLAARLGNAENKRKFFADLPAVPSETPAPAPGLPHLDATAAQLKQLLHAQNEAARLQAEVDELTIEWQYLRQWQRDNMPAAPVALERYRLSPTQVTDLMAYLDHLAGKRIRLKDRVALLLNFRILRTQPFADGESRKSMVHALQLHFYEKALRDKKAELAACRQTLERGNFQALLEALTAGSMAYLKQYLHGRVSDTETFDENGYRRNFDAFARRYPIIGSSTHSIVNSIGNGALLDYVIIDEASLQDIVPGVLALACARNAVIVGDRKQLPHIPANLGVAAPAEFYDCDRYSLLDSCAHVFKSALPATLLKEHYRCHPRIIQFCNQQFYDNALVVMTRDAGEQPLSLLVTAKGNHARGNTNRRELESFLETLKDDSLVEQEGERSRGFIAPYNAQVDLSRAHLPRDFEKKTTHKFQGMECDEIVFSTVLDKARATPRSLRFVDDPHLVNVAVSRAKHKFTLVTGDEVFAQNNGHIAALVRHIEYYADEKQVRRAPVVSAFDLLYKEYDRSLERLNARLRPGDSRYKSEQIVARILRDALSGDAYRTMTFHTQVRLSQIASSANEALTAREREFMGQGATCDFVLYFRVGKTPAGVIEVDGRSHATAAQAERDALKDSILEKSGIGLLRLSTAEAYVEEKVSAFLARWGHDDAAAAAARGS